MKPTRLWEEEEETLEKGKEKEVPSENDEIVTRDKENKEFNNLINILIPQPTLVTNSRTVKRKVTFRIGIVTHHLWVISLGEHFSPRWSSANNPLQPSASSLCHFFAT